MKSILSTLTAVIFFVAMPQLASAQQQEVPSLEEQIEKEAERLHVREHAAIINKNCKEFVMTQGGKSDITYISGEKANKLFDEVGLKYEYQEVGEGHTWYTWRINLYDEAQRLFKKK